MNIFRISADFLHLASKFILIFTIHKRRSAEGISLLTQSLYALVFCTRYVDLFLVSPGYSWYNTFFKIFYIVSSFYIIFVMMKVFQRSREDEKEWKTTAYILGFSAVMAPIAVLIFKRDTFSFFETSWTFSIILESLAVLPQLTLLAHTSIPTAITSYYLLCLGLYRAVYIPNWIYRAADPMDANPEPVAVIFGVLQTLLYIEFAWIYWRRQKVRLGGTGVLDHDEFAKGLVLGRIIARDRKVGGATGGGWRGTGLSVNADVDSDNEVRGPEDFRVDDDEDDDDLEREGDVEQGLMGRRE